MTVRQTANDTGDPLLGARLVAISAPGDAPTLLCVHPLGGGVSCYLHLARCMGTDCAMYGLQAPSPLEIADRGDGDLSIEEVAHHYADLVQRKGLRGPCWVMGWSYGGVVAFALAHEFRRRSVEVPQLFILDSRPPSWSSRAPLDETAMLAGFAMEMAVAAGQTLSLPLDSLRALEMNAQIEHVRDALVAIGVMPSQTSNAVIRQFLQGCRNRLAPPSRYRPTPYDGAVVLLRARDIDPALRTILDDADPSYGWAQLCVGPFEIVEAGGTHASILYPPHSSEAATIVRQHMAITCRSI